jgi:hypothetical protein
MTTTDTGAGYDAGFADGVNHCVRLVVDRLAEAMNEPRRNPSDRRGRITALGKLLLEMAPATDYQPQEKP